MKQRANKSQKRSLKKTPLRFLLGDAEDSRAARPGQRNCQSKSGRISLARRQPFAGGYMDTIKSDELVEHALSVANDALSKRLGGGDVYILKAGMAPPVDDVFRTEIEGVCDNRSAKAPAADRAIVLVETAGGVIETVERIVQVLRKHYKTVEFIIPNYAYSAGTILVMSGDEIYMDYYAVLGPIDPQYPSDDGNYVPGMVPRTGEPHQ